MKSVLDLCGAVKGGHLKRGLGGKAEMTGMKNPIGGFPYTDTESHAVSFELLYSLVNFFFLLNQESIT